ncbi:acetyl-CoA carboxylase biotin carboxyl carrier protein [Entomobacter blattae]|uniref:Biotin carboxyl carrier protein of acetyl-CoA carboxylase n=1 Tax=Entomobacter blattae TaxID=2762277 RepID=A0A7H1NQL9_9PROT|nr:acetyl-CoA carboxylase biotin carboxyl carrier protein subunit [Entomobacter blattae]QNT78079.1 Biotin carboxyl carrier protein of acetyl-CoA carboxylase [Entomobacter blattae]
MSHPLVDAETIRALANVLTETGLTEIEVENKYGRIRVARTLGQPGGQVGGGAFPAPVSVPVAEPSSAPAASASASAPAPGDYSHNTNAITSPMVGIAYLSPDPSSAPFVNEGQEVKEGQTLMLIEAMKTFNQIKSPRTGRVTKVLVTSGAPVEFGEALMIVE